MSLNRNYSYSEICPIKNRDSSNLCERDEDKNQHSYPERVFESVCSASNPVICYPANIPGKAKGNGPRVVAPDVHVGGQG